MITKEAILEASKSDGSLKREDLPANIEKVVKSIIKILKKRGVTKQARLSVSKFDNFSIDIEVGHDNIDSDVLVSELSSIKTPKGAEIDVMADMSPAPQNTIGL